MRMKSTGILPIELVGKITDMNVSHDWLIMHLRTSTPAGWDLKAALTHEDVRTLFRLLIKPANLWYLIVGFLRHPGDKPPPEY